MREGQSMSILYMWSTGSGLLLLLFDDYVAFQWYNYINTLASNVKYNPTHENYARFLWK